MVCGLLTQIALSAVLLGKQELRVEDSKNFQKKYCLQSEPSNANATVTFKNKKGDAILERKVYVSEFEHYLSGEQRGATLAKTANFVFEYPRTKEMKQADTVELKLNNGAYSQSAQIPTKEKTSK